MPRLARIVIPGIPHHITQRGNRRQRTFFCDDDYKIYIRFMHASCKAYGVEIWAYCLMPNHIHLIAVPQTESALCRAMGDGHQRYSRYINSRFGWKGYLWQGRFSSCPMEDKHLFNATRYVELNPVRAGICARAEEYRWSSAQAHLGMNTHEEKFVNPAPILAMYPNWASSLSTTLEDQELDRIRKHNRSGRPLGSDDFIKDLENGTNAWCNALPVKKLV